MPFHRGARATETWSLLTETVKFPGCVLLAPLCGYPAKTLSKVPNAGCLFLGIRRRPLLHLLFVAEDAAEGSHLNLGGSDLVLSLSQMFCGPQRVRERNFCSPEGSPLETADRLPRLAVLGLPPVDDVSSSDFSYFVRGFPSVFVRVSGWRKV